RTAGDPATLNVPALLLRNCVVDCRFTRRFRAVAAGNYTIALLTDEAGFTIDADPPQIDVAAGDVQEVNFNVRYTGTKENQDLFATVVLQPDDASLPTLRMPVVVRNIIGRVAGEANIVTGRRADIVGVPGLVTK